MPAGPIRRAVASDPGERPASAVYACLEHQGDYLVLATRVPLRRPVLPSITPGYPGLDRLERHLP